MARHVLPQSRYCSHGGVCDYCPYRLRLMSNYGPLIETAIAEYSLLVSIAVYIVTYELYNVTGQYHQKKEALRYFLGEGVYFGLAKTILCQ